MPNCKHVWTIVDVTKDVPEQEEKLLVACVFCPERRVYQRYLGFVRLDDANKL